MPQNHVLPLNSAASGAEEEFEIMAITYNRVVDYLHWCASNEFLVKGQAAKPASGAQLAVQNFIAC